MLWNFWRTLFGIHYLDIFLDAIFLYFVKNSYFFRKTSNKDGFVHLGHADGVDYYADEDQYMVNRTKIILIFKISLVGELYKFCYQLTDMVFSQRVLQAK